MWCHLDYYYHTAKNIKCFILVLICLVASLTQVKLKRTRLLGLISIEIREQFIGRRFQVCI